VELIWIISINPAESQQCRITNRSNQPNSNSYKSAESHRFKSAEPQQVNRPQQNQQASLGLQGANIPKPMRNWDESGLTREVLQAVEKAGYKKPSPIQMAAIPLGLQQRDVIGIAETGALLSFILSERF
jgi:superfamily II DNA/RNA helicase